MTPVAANQLYHETFARITKALRLKDVGRFDEARLMLEDALVDINKIIAMYPDPGIHNEKGFVLKHLGRFEEAAATAARVSRSPNPRYWADALLVASLFRLGRESEAGAAKEMLLEREPDFTVGEFQSTQRGFESIAKQLGSALREAGLPE